MRVVLVVAALAVSGGLAARGAMAAETGWGFVKVSDDGQGFVVGGEAWHPIGCNYYDPETGWAPKLWQKFDAGRVEEHFRIMEELGVNVVRVFLTAQSFFPDPPKLEPEALEKFNTMLSIAKRHGIRVHPTGPDHWEGTPDWRRTDFLADPKALEAQVAFWRAFAARYREEPAIFAYDLLNEPHVRWDSPAMKAQWPEWLRKKYGTVGDLCKAWEVERETLDSFESAPVPEDKGTTKSQAVLDYQRFREWIGERWVKVQVDAIRSVDSNHPVTVGLIQWSVPVLHGRPSRYAAIRPSRIEPMIDFQSVHFYPFYGGDPTGSEGAMQSNLAYLEFVLRYVKAGAPGKPLLVGEFGWRGGGGKPDREAESEHGQERWCTRAMMQGRGIAAGWLNWAYADTPSSRDLSKFSGLVTAEGRKKLWGLAFSIHARKPSEWTSGLPAPKTNYDFDVDRALVDPDAANRMLAEYYEAWKAEGRAELRVTHDQAAALQ